jgi:hypothetical protein
MVLLVDLTHESLEVTPKLKIVARA